MADAERGDDDGAGAGADGQAPSAAAAATNGGDAQAAPQSEQQPDKTSSKRSLSMGDLETVDLEKDDLDWVMSCLRTTPEGLTPEVAQHRLEKFGRNALEKKEKSKLLLFLSFMWNPLSWVMEAAALVAILLTIPGNGSLDWEDFTGIVLLLFINATIGYIEETNAGDAVAALMDALAPKAKVLRGGEWSEIDASNLVIGDIVALKLGDIVPADCRIVSGKNNKIDQAALTGESLPVTKHEGDIIFSGSTVKQGEFQAVVMATGANTFFGKAAHLVESTDTSSHLQEILAAIGKFCISFIALFVVLLVIIQYAAEGYAYSPGINNVLVLLIGGVPIAMPTVLSVTLAIGAHELADKQAIVTRMTAIEEMAGMDILCSDKTGTLTLNKLTIDREGFVTMAGYSVDECMVQAGRASRVENQDAIDFAVVNSLDDPSKAREGIEELNFVPFNPTDKRTEITYRDKSDGKVYRATKGAPQVILGMAHNKEKIEQEVHKDIENMASRGFRALGIAVCDVPSGDVDGEAGTWQMTALMPIFDPPRHDTKQTIETALSMGVQVKMVTGDQLAIAKETARRLGLGTNIYNTDVLQMSNQRASAELGATVGEVAEEADGFAGVFPEDKYNIVQVLQDRKHVVGMTGDGVNDAPALKKAQIGVAVSDATDAARGASDIVLTEPGLSVIIDAILASRQIFQRMKNYSMYACSVTVRIVVTFSIMAWAWRFNMPPFMVLILAYLNDGTIMTISKDRVKPSPYPDMWHLMEVFATATVLGLYLTLSTLIFFTTLFDTTFWSDTFNLKAPWRVNNDPNNFVLHSIIYLQVSIIGQALIFVTRSFWFFFMDRPGVLLMMAFVVAQLVATFITVYADWGFTRIAAAGWGWALAVWVWSVIWFIPLDLVKIGTRWVIKGDKTAWRNMWSNRIAFRFHRGANNQQRTSMGGGVSGAQRRASLQSSVESYRASMQQPVRKFE